MIHCMTQGHFTWGDTPTLFLKHPSINGPNDLIFYQPVLFVLCKCIKKHFIRKNAGVTTQKSTNFHQKHL